MPDEDVISAVNEALIKAIDDFDYTRGVRFTCYLFPIIKGVVSRLWKKESPAGRVELSEADGTGSAESPDEEFARKEEGELLLKALDAARGKLTGKERALLIDYYSRGRNFAEIGRRQGVTREAVRAQHARVIEKLRKLMKGARE